MINKIYMFGAVEPVVTTYDLCIQGDVHTFTYHDGEVVGSAITGTCDFPEVEPEPTTSEPVPAPLPAKAGHGVFD